MPIRRHPQQRRLSIIRWGCHPPPLSTLVLASTVATVEGMEAVYGFNNVGSPSPRLLCFHHLQICKEVSAANAPGRTPFPRSGLWEQASHLGVG